MQMHFKLPPGIALAVQNILQKRTVKCQNWNGQLDIIMKTKRNVFFTFWHYVLFLVDTVYSWCRFRLFSLNMYVITILSTIYFVIIRLGAAALFNTMYTVVVGKFMVCHCITSAT